MAELRTFVKPFNTKAAKYRFLKRINKERDLFKIKSYFLNEGDDKFSVFF